LRREIHISEARSFFLLYVFKNNIFWAQDLGRKNVGALPPNAPCGYGLDLYRPFC